MGKVCKKCGYERRPDDYCPDYECPHCGIIYEKFDAYNANKERLQSSKALYLSKALREYEAISGTTALDDDLKTIIVGIAEKKFEEETVNTEQEDELQKRQEFEQKETKATQQLWLAIILLFFGILLILAAFAILFHGVNSGSNNSGSNNSGANNSGANKTMAFVMSQQFIKQKLKAPKTADFPWYDESYVKYLGKGKYRVSAYVDAQNSFGATIRTHYTCILENTNGDTWSLLDIYTN